MTVTDLLFDAFLAFGAKGCHCPIPRAAANMMGEVFEKRRAFWRVDDFGVELYAVEFLFIIGNHRMGRTFGCRDNAKAFGQCANAVTMAHPHCMAPTNRPNMAE